MKDLPNTPAINAAGVQARIEFLAQRTLAGETRKRALLLALSMIDLTTLEGCDSEGKVRQLCEKAKNLHNGYPGIPTVAAVCVYPPLVKTAKAALTGTSIKVAAVASSFPSGMSELSVRVEDTKSAVAAGADEIDMVISRGRFLAGDETYLLEEVKAIKAACGNAHLKVILETGELNSLTLVRRASDLAIAGGADFIKTSTGKIKPAATPPVTLVMLEAIRDHYYRTGQRIGMKPAGGIATADEALSYLVMVAETLGDEWLTPDLFRFGASRLANAIVKAFLESEEGRPVSPNELSSD